MNSTLALLLVAGFASITIGSTARAQDQSGDDLPSMKSLVATMEEVAGDQPEKRTTKKTAKAAPVEESSSTGQPEDEVVDAATSRLEEKSDSLAMDDEITEADRTGYQESAAQSLSETAQLKKEIASLQKQVKSATVGTERAKKSAALAEKKLDYEKHLQAAAQAKLAHKEVLERAQLARVDKTKAKIAAVEENLLAKGERNRLAESKVRDLEKEQAQLNKRLEKANLRIAQAKRLQQALEAKRERLAKSNRKLKSQVSQAEAKTARRSSGS